MPSGPQAEKLKTKIIKDVAAKTRKGLRGKQAAQAESFVQQLYARVPPDDILHDTVENLAGASTALLGFAKQRSKNTTKVRVYNPTAKKNGWTSSHSIAEIVNDDMPFLVDSVTAALNRLGLEVQLVIHPIMLVKRTAKGGFDALREPGDEPAGAGKESFMHVQFSELPDDELGGVAAELERVLADVRCAVEDWRAMRERCQTIITDLAQNPPPVGSDQGAEAIAFLNWMEDNNFTYLGYRYYTFEGRGRNAVAKIQEGSGLGILRNVEFRVFDGLRNLGKLPKDVQDFVQQPELLRVNRANQISTVHRPVHLDTIVIKTYDQKGRVTGERLFIGLFTSVAYSRSPRDIPLLRKKVDRTFAKAGFAPGSHDGKALMHILETYPRDELFQASDEELYSTAVGILHLQERQHIALFLRRDPFERFISCLVYVPRDRYDTALRLKFQRILAERFAAEIAAFDTHLSGEALARVHIILRTKPGAVPKIDQASLEAELVEAGRSWIDRLTEALVAAHGEQLGIRLSRRFAAAFPIGYQEHFSIDDAVFDLGKVQQAADGGQLEMDLYQPDDLPDGQIRFKIYHQGTPISLSDILPTLGNMGLKVLTERPFRLEINADTEVWIHDFTADLQTGSDFDLDQVKADFHDSFAGVWAGALEDDGFNRLVLQSGLNARQVTILRAYCKYLRQAKIPFSQAYMEETLGRNTRITRLLVELFETRFDPAAKKGAEARATKLAAEVTGLLEHVSNLDEDRIIRRFLNVIQSTLRTNFYQPAEDGAPKSYSSFKLDSRRIDELPQPRPFREIFVYSPRVEGVHLRFGMVARGGLRWSDRREDFRTEILGLVKAQQVKNAVIVPVGSKGGFVVKRPPAAADGREAFLAEGIECYKTFIRGLLDITDNLKGGKIVPPKQVTRHDQDDPYLVVAADKGTATFSDIANGVSIDYGHWLGDAFASGGSAGYDHKKMGITAKGAWESVKRHFRETGKDIQNEDFTCIGCGDMAGDVFGNGMLLSKHIKLVGAFNHMHIFVDPDPDSAKSWVERKRLFDLPRSSWTDYNKALMSKGGGIFERSAKSLPISSQMKTLFGIEEDTLTPNALIRAMLQADVELLWFGGIGTYVRARSESDADVGDRANDPLRVTGSELGAKVVGEGANLGMTQQGRIEYGLSGGRCNTDAIDNSAGVDCSDHEVNIKILLGDAESRGKMSRKQRDRLLEKMTDEVSDLVLRDNYLQSQAITVTHQIGAHLLDRLARFMRSLEKAGQLDRQLEFLPDDETVDDRMKAGIGLTRPELSVLISYSKIVLYDELLESDLPDDPYLMQDLLDYFPTPLRKTYATEISRHQLRREIIATVITNEMVNRSGITFIHEVREKTGMPSPDIARAFLISRQIFGISGLWRQIEGLDNKAPATLQATMLAETGRLIERGTVWFLREVGQSLGIKQQIDAYGAGVGWIYANLESIIDAPDRQALNDRMATFMEGGAPKALARDVAALSLMSPACDIVRIAQNAKLSVEHVARAYFSIGARFGFDWLRRAAGHLSTDTAWDKLAVTAIIDDFFGHQGDLTAKVLDGGNGKAAAAEALVDSWAAAHRPMVARTEQLLTELKGSATPDLAMLAVANRQLKSMVAG